MLSLRPMTEVDLALVGRWLRRPHVARWWTPDTTAAAEVARYRDRIRAGAGSATRMLTVCEDDNPVGWCQWYWWADYPDDGAALGTLPGEAGIDYAIGEPERIGRGIGTALAAALVAEVRGHRPGAGIVADPDARNVASRRVLEKNGFLLVAVRRVATEAGDAPMAIYRLAGTETAPTGNASPSRGGS